MALSSVKLALVGNLPTEKPLEESSDDSPNHTSRNYLVKGKTQDS
jgi:hypothetical protein